MKKPQVAIENPCHEDWQKMTAENEGRFCQSCEKIVVDFTDMSDAEILQYFSKPRAEKTCGRFRVGQISQPLQTVHSMPSIEVKESTAALPQVYQTSPKPSKALLHFAYLLILVMGLSACSDQVQLGKVNTDQTGLANVKGQVIKVDAKKDSSHNVVAKKVKKTSAQKILMGDTVYIKGEVNRPLHIMGKPAIIERVKPSAEEPKIMGECVMPFPMESDGFGG